MDASAEPFDDRHVGLASALAHGLQAVASTAALVWAGGDGHWTTTEAPATSCSTETADVLLVLA